MSQASQLRTYDRSTSVVFLKTNERFGGLSNMAPAFPLRVSGIRIRTSEALYQACRFPHMPDVQRKIIDEHSPMTAKMRSKPFRNDSRPDWDAVRVKIMRWCLRVKLAHHWSTFGKMLLDTVDKPIVEQSRKDDFWGAKVGDDDKLVGMNVLGRLLMELREEIKSGMRERATVVLPLEVPDFLLLGQSIEPVGFGSKFDAARSQEGRRQNDFREIPAPVEPDQRSLFEPLDEATEGRATESQFAMQSPPPAAHPQKIDDLRPYTEMKPSGLPWLGEVPGHWELLRTGRVFREVAHIGFPDLELLSIQSGVGIVKQSGTGRKVRASEDRSSYKRIEPGWLGYNLMNAFFGGIGMSIHEGILSPAYAVARPRFEICPRYFQYLYHSPNWLAEFNRESYGIMYERNRLYFDRFRMIRSVVPPLDEQRLIVRFLDWHGAQTAKLIRAKKKIIALLNEQKQAIIHRVVTRGLDPNVRLRPSGIPWLGDVPDGWEVSKLKRLARLRSGESITAFQIEDCGEYPVYGGNGHRGYATRFTHDGDFILIGRQGALCGNIHRAIAKFFASEHAIVAHPRTKYETRWFEEILRVMNLNQYSIAAAQPGLSIERIEVLKLPVPPVEEQATIVSWIDRETAELNTAIRLANHEITLIQEFRTRLIADVVTGKIDVRAVAASLPDTVEPETTDELVEDDDLVEPVDDTESEEVAA